MEYNLKKLIVYRNLLEDEIIKNLQKKQFNNPLFLGKIINWAENNGIQGNVIEKYILEKLSKDDNIFTRNADIGSVIGESLLSIVTKDLKSIVSFIKNINLSIDDSCLLKKYSPSNPQDNNLLDKFAKILLSKGEPQSITQQIYKFHTQYSFGIMSDYQAFVWKPQQGLVGVVNKQLDSFDKLVGYEYQKTVLRENTQAFLKGLPANNVLLFGDRGTGKSSSIKALVPEYADQGLRLIEVSKTDFGQIPEIMAILSKYGRKFILILDDLSFERFEIEYKQLKSYMEGTLEQKPHNVLIYATSNRRNIINETWEEQQGEEIHVRDSINERTSLVDRFGIKIYYESPGQEAYFKIVEALAKRNNLQIPTDILRAEANKWQMCSSGRSGRIAKSFINHLLAENAKNSC